MKSKSEDVVGTSFPEKGATIVDQTEAETRATRGIVAHGGKTIRRAVGEVETSLKAKVEGTTAVGGTIGVVETGARLLLRECEEITGK